MIPAIRPFSIQQSFLVYLRAGIVPISVHESTHTWHDSRPPYCKEPLNSKACDETPYLQELKEIVYISADSNATSSAHLNPLKIWFKMHCCWQTKRHRCHEYDNTVCLAFQPQFTFAMNILRRDLITQICSLLLWVHVKFICRFLITAANKFPNYICAFFKAKHSFVFLLPKIHHVFLINCWAPNHCNEYSSWQKEKDTAVVQLLLAQQIFPGRSPQLTSWMWLRWIWKKNKPNCSQQFPWGKVQVTWWDHQVGHIMTYFSHCHEGVFWP